MNSSMQLTALEPSLVRRIAEEVGGPQEASVVLAGVMLGALAQAWRARGARAQADFEQMFPEAARLERAALRLLSNGALGQRGDRAGGQVLSFEIRRRGPMGALGVPGAMDPRKLVRLLTVVGLDRNLADHVMETVRAYVDRRMTAFGVHESRRPVAV